MTPQRPKLPPFQRWLRGIAGVALLLLYPTCNVVRFHWDSEDIADRHARFAEQLEKKPDQLVRAEIRCGVPREDPPVYDTARYFKLTASSFTHPRLRHTGKLPGPSLLWSLDIDLVRPVRRLMDLGQEAKDAVYWGWEISRSRCTRAAPEDAPEYEAKIAAEARESAAKLRKLLPRARRLMAEHQEKRPVLAGLAWSLLVFEIVGGIAALMVLLPMLWRFMVRRMQTPAPREDPHWRTSEEGQQAPRSSPWFLALILLGSVALMAMMMIAQRC